jgi:hypothetical protein
MAVRIAANCSGVILSNWHLHDSAQQSQLVVDFPVGDIRRRGTCKCPGWRLPEHRFGPNRTSQSRRNVSPANATLVAQKAWNEKALSHLVFRTFCLIRVGLWPQAIEIMLSRTPAGSGSPSRVTPSHCKDHNQEPSRPDSSTQWPERLCELRRLECIHTAFMQSRWPCIRQHQPTPWADWAHG